MRVTILASVRERETCRIVETARRAMDHFRNQRQRLKCAWSKFFHEQEISKVFKIFLVRDCEHGSESFQIDVSCVNLVM